MTEHYRTAKGSTVEVSGKNRGITVIDFDWLEEGVCRDAHPTADVADRKSPVLHWSCNNPNCLCDGSADLKPYNPMEQNMPDVHEAFQQAVKGNEDSHVGLFIITPDSARCSIVHTGEGRDEKVSAKELLRSALQNFLSVFEGDDFDHDHAALHSGVACAEIIGDYIHENNS